MQGIIKISRGGYFGIACPLTNIDLEKITSEIRFPFISPINFFF